MYHANQVAFEEVGGYSGGGKMLAGPPVSSNSRFSFALVPAASSFLSGVRQLVEGRRTISAAKQLHETARSSLCSAKQAIRLGLRPARSIPYGIGQLS